MPRVLLLDVRVPVLAAVGTGMKCVGLAVLAGAQVVAGVDGG